MCGAHFTREAYFICRRHISLVPQGTNFIEKSTAHAVLFSWWRRGESFSPAGRNSYIAAFGGSYIMLFEHSYILRLCRKVILYSPRNCAQAQYNLSVGQI